MTNNIEALKKLYVAMGGQAADVANLTITPEIISAIADVYQGGGSDLPEVTSEDNGDVLQVIEGAWGKGKAPSSLPAVTGEDNGKLLGVDNGAWGVVNAPAGSVTITASAGAVTAFANAFAAFLQAALTSAGEITSYETTGDFETEFSAIQTAIASGKIVYFYDGTEKAVITAATGQSVYFRLLAINYKISEGNYVNVAADVYLSSGRIHIYGYATLAT